jgi:hypothetical protein
LLRLADVFGSDISVGLQCSNCALERATVALGRGGFGSLALGIDLQKCGLDLSHELFVPFSVGVHPGVDSFKLADFGPKCFKRKYDRAELCYTLS